MSETARTTQSTAAKPWVTWVLIAVVVAIFVASLLAGQGADFGGTDSLATEAMEDAGATPWLEPLFEPSGEVESGLFALQAALGAGLLGYVLGRLRCRAAGHR